MSIVHVDKIWIEIAKNFEIRTSGGGGGGSVISDTPGEEGGQKVANFCGRPLWMSPNAIITSYLTNNTFLLH